MCDIPWVSITILAAAFTAELTQGNLLADEPLNVRPDPHDGLLLKPRESPHSYYLSEGGTWCSSAFRTRVAF